jgi:hypothetical protein
MSRTQKGQTLNTIRIALAIGLAGALLSACGSSSSGSSTTSSTSKTTASTASGTNSARRAALRTCLAKHGVTLPSRPPGSGTGRRPNGTPPAGGGLFFGGGGGANGNRFANNPKLAAAFRACGGQAFGGGGRRFQLSHTAITNFVACVRKHGFAAMPSPNFSGNGKPVFPASIRTNKQFVAASKACANLLVAPGARPPAGSSST